MALTGTNMLGQLSNATGAFGAGSFTTNNFTPPDNSILVVGVAIIENGSTGADPQDDLTISGGGLTFTPQLDVGSGNSFATGCRTWTATVTTGALMALTLDCGARAIAFYFVGVRAYTGYNTGTPIGDSVATHLDGGFPASPSPTSITLSGNPATTSEVFTVIALNRQVAGTDPGADQTEQYDLTNTDWGGGQVQTRDNSTSDTISWDGIRENGGALFGWAAVALEIQAETQTVIAVGTAQESNSAQPLGSQYALTLGVATETDTARPLGGQFNQTLGIAGETATARPLGQGSGSMTQVFTVQSPALPCSGWDVDVGCCPDWDTYDTDLQQNAAEYGAFTVWAATGRRFGLCTRVVRPCGRTCTTNGVNGYYWSEGTWLPYIFNGVWRNCWCGCGSGPGCCSCEPQCQVLLQGPVSSITEVTVDGAVVDPATYRVDNGQWLVRTKQVSDDDCWPECQNYDLNSGDGTFIVTYQQGLAVPGLLQRAAGMLACEWAKSCLGQPCSLPQRVSSVSRQGVSINMVPVEDLLRHGLTGVFTVDQLIRNFNPYGLTSAMRIDSPDVEKHRTVTWP